MTDLPKSNTRRLARGMARAVCLLVAAITLSGCIVVPAGGYYRHYPRYYYPY